MSELSMKKHCYVPLSTLKRAESGKPVSIKTCASLENFFGVSNLYDSPQNETDGDLMELKLVTINQKMIVSLRDYPEYQPILDCCQKLFFLLQTYSNAPELEGIFHFHV